MALVATNFFGQTTPAIAATEAQYAEMWAQDAAAMYGYVGSSASATALTPFTPPAPTTNPGGPAGQAAAVGHAVGTSAGNVQSTISSVPQAFSAVPNVLQSIATTAPAAAADPADPLSTLSNLITVFVTAPNDLAALLVETPMAPLAAVDLPYIIIGTVSGLDTDEIISGWAGVEPWPGTGPAPPTEFPATLTGPIAVSPASVSAGLGQANTVGALSVPQTWTVEAPAARAVAMTTTSVSATAGTTAEALTGASGNTFSNMALAGMTGQAMVGTRGTGGGQDGDKAAAGKRVAARAGDAPTAGDGAVAHGEGEAGQSRPRTVVTGIAARIREIAKLRDEGNLTDEEFTEEKNRLLGL
jgi:PPE-repeat protein